MRKPRQVSVKPHTHALLSAAAEKTGQSIGAIVEDALNADPEFRDYAVPMPVKPRLRRPHHRNEVES